jgi:hypothetical protein
MLPQSSTSIGVKLSFGPGTPSSAMVLSAVVVGLWSENDTIAAPLSVPVTWHDPVGTPLVDSIPVQTLIPHAGKCLGQVPFKGLNCPCQNNAQCRCSVCMSQPSDFCHVCTDSFATWPVLFCCWLHA